MLQKLDDITKDAFTMAIGQVAGKHNCKVDFHPVHELRSDRILAHFKFHNKVGKLQCCGDLKLYTRNERKFFVYSIPALQINNKNLISDIEELFLQLQFVQIAYGDEITERKLVEHHFSFKYEDV